MLREFLAAELLPVIACPDRAPRRAAAGIAWLRPS